MSASNNRAQRRASTRQPVRAATPRATSMGAHAHLDGDGVRFMLYNEAGRAMCVLDMDAGDASRLGRKLVMLFGEPT